MAHAIRSSGPRLRARTTDLSRPVSTHGRCIGSCTHRSSSDTNTIATLCSYFRPQRGSISSSLTESVHRIHAKSPKARFTSRQSKSATTCHAQAEDDNQENAVPDNSDLVHNCTRRQLSIAALTIVGSTAAGSRAPSLAAFRAPPPGYRIHTDPIDGYTFLYPEEWQPLNSTGVDVFFRDLRSLEENAFVELSSPSKYATVKYTTVADLGSAEDAAKKFKEQYLVEFMSTRIGVRRESSIVGASERTGADGKLYYDLEYNIKSFADVNQFAITPQERVTELEWNRHLFTTLGVANNRLYQFRIQAPEERVSSFADTVRAMRASFKVTELD